MISLEVGFLDATDVQGSSQVKVKEVRISTNRKDKVHTDKRDMTLLRTPKLHLLTTGLDLPQGFRHRECTIQVELIWSRSEVDPIALCDILII